MDLSEYLDGSGQYTEEDFVRQAVELYTYEGQIMAIPACFTLFTLVGNSDIVGDRMGWNMEDVRAMIEAYPDALIFDIYPSSTMFYVSTRNMLTEFVDFEGKKADFDSREYVDFLNFMNQLPDNYTEREAKACYMEGDVWLREGRALLSYRRIYSIYEFQLLDYIFEGRYTCIGYPSSDRRPDCIIDGSDAYGITAASAHKEGAWNFIEWCYSQQDGSSRDGFPSRVDMFEGALEEAAGEEHDGNKGFSFGGAYVAYREVTQEEVELLYELLECASPEKRTEQTIVDIMEEEAAYLFDGSKTAEDVAKVTQNRVQLYLNEND